MLGAATDDGRAGVVEGNAQATQAGSFGARLFLVPDHLPYQRQPAAADRFRPRQASPATAAFTPLPFQVEIAHRLSAVRTPLARRVRGEPVAHLLPKRLVVCREVKIHDAVSR